MNADRSIKVRQGDWLSKYTMAIWGDYKDEHLQAFKRKINGAWRDIDNPALIKAGETLYVRATLPGEDGFRLSPLETKSGGSLPATGRAPDFRLSPPETTSGGWLPSTEPARSRPTR